MQSFHIKDKSNIYVYTTVTIVQNIQGPKLSWLDYLVTIHGKTFAVASILPQEICKKIFVVQGTTAKTRKVLSLSIIQYYKAQIGMDIKVAKYENTSSADYQVNL